MYGDSGLIVFCRRKSLIGFSRDGRIFLDQLGHDATQCLDAQRKRRHIQQQYVLHIATEHTTLYGSSHGHGLIRIHVLTRLFAKEILYRLLNLGHSDLPTD